MFCVVSLEWFPPTETQAVHSAREAEIVNFKNMNVAQALVFISDDCAEYHAHVLREVGYLFKVLVN